MARATKIKLHTLGCPTGYQYHSGDVHDWGDVANRLRINRHQCAQRCSGEGRCKSFEHSNSEGMCNLNSQSSPTKGPNGDYVFCSKQGKSTHIQYVSNHYNGS